MIDSGDNRYAIKEVQIKGVIDIAYVFVVVIVIYVDRLIVILLYIVLDLIFDNTVFNTLIVNKISKEDRKAMKAQGIKLRDKEAVAAYFAKKAEEEAAAKEQAEAEAKAKAEADRLANPTTEDLLKAILTELQSK